MSPRPALAARRLGIGAGLALLLAACGDAPPPDFGAVGQTNPAPRVTLMRFPRAGGAAELYRLPGLDRIDWTSRETLPPLARAVGADLDERLVYLADTARRVVALDLETGRVRSRDYLANVRDAAVGPTGALYTVDQADSVTLVVRRNRFRLAGRLPGRPRELYGTGSDQLLAVVPGDGNRLAVLDRAAPPKVVRLPDGDPAATFWGDLVAVAADSAVVLYEPRAREPVRSLDVGGRAKTVVFSPSGHHLYVAGDGDDLVVVDRFNERVIDEIDLPGPVGALRPDPFGHWLLVRPPETDSVWVVDLARRRYVGAWATRWGADLPAVAGVRTLLLRQGGDLVAYDLGRQGAEAGRIRGGAADLWLALAWSPEPREAEEAPADTAEAAADTTGSARVYLQLSSSQNPTWADAFARQLRDADLPASVLPPREGEDGYRVVLGPYPSREEAEDVGRRLGRPFFIYQPPAP